MKNNIKNNMLSLKALQAELEQIKSAQAQQVHNNHPHTDVAGHDIKGSYINRIYMKSSSMLLFLLSGLLSYGHKIPFIAKIITVLSLWYGKTTWWRILIIIRKIFVVFNAIIGVFIVFKSVGFSIDNILAGFTAMGHQYLEILSSFTSRLFNWFVELFDHKIVPNRPTNPGNTPWWNPYKQGWWYSRPMVESTEGKMIELAKSQDFYKSPINLTVNYNTPWYKDLTTWLWIGGSIVGVGLLYLGYKFCTDPLFIQDLFGQSDIKGKGKAPSIDPQGSDIPLDEISSGSDTTNKIIAFNRYVISKLNPFNYITSAEDYKQQHKMFNMIQSRVEIANTKYYPYTSNNPYDPWYKKLNLYFFGESLSESAHRLQLKENAYDIYNKIKVKGGNTPIPSNLGLSTPIPSIPSFFDAVQANNVENKLKSIPSTPKVYLYNNNLPSVIINEASEVADWNTHVKDTVEDMTSTIDEYFTQKAIDKNLIEPYVDNIASISKVTLDELPLENPFTE
jgi:hypothetical protein